MSSDDDFTNGYLATRRFYGEATRDALTRIQREIAQLRTEFRRCLQASRHAGQAAARVPQPLGARDPGPGLGAL